MTSARVRPLLFTELLLRLGVRLERGQHAYARVAFDGVDPCELDDYVRGSARVLFGDIEVVPASCRRVVAATCGGRSGKSYLGALRLLHLASTVPLDRLAPGEIGVALVVAPDVRLGRQTLRYVKGAVKSIPALTKRIKTDNEDSLVLEREGGRLVSIEVLPATRGGASLRGRTLVAALLDEAAFFRDENYAVNDVELFRAIAPRVIPEGQLVIQSTPWAKTGLLWELYRDNWAHPKTAIAAHASTRAMRSDPHILEQVASEYERDPANAAREFGAEFAAMGSGQFFEEPAIESAISSGLELGKMPLPGEEISSGGDFGFVRNSSVLCIVHQRDGIYTVAELFELQPDQGEPLKPSKVVAEFATVLRRHRCDSVLADGHYREAIAEHLDTHGIGLLPAPEGQGGKAESYARTKQLLREGRVKIPNDRRLLAQLRAVTSRPTPGGHVSIQSPTTADGAHGDLVSALVLALWQASGALVEEAPPARGTKAHDDAWLRAEEERRAARAQRQVEWWEEPDSGGTDWAA